MSIFTFPLFHKKAGQTCAAQSFQLLAERRSALHRIFSLQLAQLGTLSGILHGPAHLGELCADGVGGSPVLGLLGGGTLLHQFGHLGGNFVLLAVVHQAQHAGDLVEGGSAGFESSLTGSGGQGVDVLHEVEDSSQGIGGVQVVVHGGAEFLLCFLGLLLQHLVGAELGLTQGKVEVLAAGVEALEAVLAALDEVHGVVQRHPVAGGQHEVADGLVAVEVGHVADGEEVVQALGHLLIIHVDEAVVHPVAGELAAVGALALGDLVLMVGEDEVLTAAVEVDGLAQMGAAHGAALDVPARTAHAVGAFPCGLAGLCGLPHGKVGGVFLQVVVHLAAQLTVAALEVVQLQVAQLAVFRVALDAEVHIAVLGNVGVAGVDQVLHDVEDLLDVLGGAGLDGGLFAVEAGGVLEVLGLKALGHFFHGSALFLALFDELVVDIRNVGNVEDLVAPVLQVAAQGVKHDQRAGIADVDIVVNGGAADIDAVLARHLRHELFFLAGQGVKDLHDDILLFVGRPRAAEKQKPLLPCPTAQQQRRFVSESRFHSGLSLKADNGGLPRCDTAFSHSVLPGRTLHSGLQTGSQPMACSLCTDGCRATLPG